MHDFIFRGLVLPDKDEWVYGDRKVDKVGEICRTYIRHRETGLEYEVDETTIGVYTQQYDLDNICVYSLDIVELMTGPKNFVSIGVVHYYDDIGSFVVDRDGALETISDWWPLSTKYTPTRVIGNLIQNPELLDNIMG